MTEHLQDHPVLVVDFGAQYAQLIARRVRECALYSEVVPHTMSAAEMLAKEPAAIVLSGGPSSVYAEGAPSLDVALLEAGVPVFGICYGFQAMADALGGTVGHTGGREYGNTTATITHTESVLFAGQPAEQNVWMSHGDGVTEAPAGMTVCARTPGAPVAAFEDPARKLFGVQWHPEVLHSTFGQPVLEIPKDLYIPPDALEVILEAFEGPLDLLLYLIRKQNFNILDIPLADVTRQYLAYVDQSRGGIQPDHVAYGSWASVEQVPHHGGVHRRITTDQVGDVAAAAGIGLHELVSDTPSLEEVFMAATAESIDYRGGQH